MSQFVLIIFLTFHTAEGGVSSEKVVFHRYKTCEIAREKVVAAFKQPVGERKYGRSALIATCIKTK